MQRTARGHRCASHLRAAVGPALTRPGRGEESGCRADLHLIYQGHVRDREPDAARPSARRDHRRRDRRKQRRLPPHPARRDLDHADRQGSPAQPGRIDRSRVQLHLPGGSLQGDDRADARVHAPVPRPGRLHRVRRDRGRPHARAHAGARASRRLGPHLGDRAGLAADSGRDQGDGPVHRRVAAAGRLLHAGRRRRGLAAGGDDHARARRRGRDHRLGQHRGARA